MIEILRQSYNVVFLGVFVFFILLHRKNATEDRKKEVMKILVLVAAWSTFLIYINLQQSTASVATERTFLSKLP